MKPSIVVGAALVAVVAYELTVSLLEWLDLSVLHPLLPVGAVFVALGVVDWLLRRFGPTNASH